MLTVLSLVLVLVCAGIIYTLQIFQTQIHSLEASLSSHLEESNLLRDVEFTVEALPGGHKAEVTVYLTPKAYTETYNAYLIVEHESENTSMWESTLCTWTGSRYACTIQLPRLNGYQFSFRLENDYGFQTQDLDIQYGFDLAPLTDLDNYMASLS